MSNYLLKERAPGLDAALALAKSQKMMRPEQTATFNGSANQCLEIPSNADLAMDVNRPLFCGGWIKCNGPFPPAAPQWGMYKWKQPSTLGGDYGWGVNFSTSAGVNLPSSRFLYERKSISTGALAGFFTGSSPTLISPAYTPFNGNWRFLTWAFDPQKWSDNVGRLYFGRGEEITSNFAQAAGFVNADGSDEPLRFGGTGGAGTNSGILANSGEVNLASFFVCRPNPLANVPTLFAQIRGEMFNNGYGRSYRSLSDKDKSDFGLVSFWNLDSIEDGVFKDSHGSNHAQIVNGVTVS